MDVWEKYNNKGENVRVCVMDTGVNRDHPDLDESRLFGYEGDELVQPWWRDVDGHGTHVSGTIAASDNTQGVVGVAPGAEIFTARVFSTNGQFYSSNIITALQVCKDGGAQVISMSLGGPYAVSYELQAYTDLYEKFGIVTVAASGNTGGTDLLYPASYDNVISVGSVNWNSDRSSFSTKNSKVDVAAPGSSIVSYKSQEFGSCWIEHLSLLEKAIVLPVRFLLSLVAKHMGKRKLRHYQRNIHVVPTCFWCGCTHAECQSVCHSIAGLCCVGKILRESQHYWKRR
jgi:subtilisin family serine protease